MAEEAILTGTAKELVFKLARIEDDRVFDVIVHREKRSLNQNAYYHLLLGKVADKLRISKTRLHNDMLRHYGQPMLIDGKPVCVMIPDTDESENIAWESDTVHLKPTSATVIGKNDKTYRQYVMLRGSSTFDSREMSILIEGVVQEAKQLGIETLTPQELEEMRLMALAKEEKSRIWQERTNVTTQESDTENLLALKK